LKRSLTTGPDDIPHHLILSVLFRQAIATADAAGELIGVGACDAAQVQLRALMEARWGLMLAIRDPKKWGTHLYVASRREQLSQISKAIPGTPEHESDGETRDLINRYGGKPVISPDDAEKHREALEKILERPQYAAISAGFAQFVKEKHHEPPWYYDTAAPKNERLTSIWKLASEVGAAGEYKSIYHHASYFMHGGYTGTHLTTDERGVAVTPIRSPANARPVLLLGFSLLADCCMKVIDYWRPDERTRFTQKYVDEWREVIRQMPEIKIGMGEAVNRT